LCSKLIQAFIEAHKLQKSVNAATLEYAESFFYYFCIVVVVAAAIIDNINVNAHGSPDHLQHRCCVCSCSRDGW
jgi:hypothetical protein